MNAVRTFNVQEFIAQDDWVVVRGHPYTQDDTSRDGETECMQVYTLHDGKIVQLKEAVEIVDGDD